jgi:hypothetical protein
VDLSSLVTHAFGLDDINDALDLLASSREDVMVVALHPGQGRERGILEAVGAGALDDEC